MPAGAKPYDWDETTGLARRFVPGQPGGMHTLTGLAHDRESHVAYDPDINEEGLRARSLKLAALQKTLKAPPVFGEASGDLLVIGWGSTKGAIEEAVEHPARRGPQGVVDAPALPAAAAAGHQGNHAALQAGDDDREQLERRPATTKSSTRPTAAIRRSRCCCARATWSTSIAGARCAASRSSPARICRVIREKLNLQDAQGGQVMNTATECLLRMCDEHHELEDYQSGVPRWCTGCGDNAILTAVQRLCRDENLRPEKTVFVSGIGCSSRFPHYMKTYGFHGIHGRALPIAEGVKMARPDLNVFVNTGDGDCCSIGAAHWIHAIRYNMNMTVMLHDNQIYGLTKKQASPTSPIGTKSNTTPRGTYLEALNPLTVTLGVQNVSFVAQAVDWIPEMLYDIVQGGLPPQGLLVRAHRPALPGVAAEAVRPVAARPEPHAPAAPRARAAAELRTGQDLPQPAGARSVEHPPRARDRRGTDPIPVGILYRNPDVPCYEETRHAGQPRTASLVRTGLEAELDKYTVWPQ